MTDDEIQAAKSSVEQAKYGLVVPTEEEQKEIDAAALAFAEQSEALAGDIIARGESDDHVGKPTLQGSIP